MPIVFKLLKIKYSKERLQEPRDRFKGIYATISGIYYLLCYHLNQSDTKLNKQSRPDYSHVMRIRQFSFLSSDWPL